MAKSDGNPYENLAAAIIVTACNDYRMTLKKIRRNPNNKEAMREAMELERFFHSPWYSTLTSVDGDFIIRKIRAEIADGR